MQVNYSHFEINCLFIISTSHKWGNLAKAGKTGHKSKLFLAQIIKAYEIHFPIPLCFMGSHDILCIYTDVRKLDKQETHIKVT